MSEEKISIDSTSTLVLLSVESVSRHCCKSILFHEGEPWSKKHNKNSFDVPMGSFHGAEICELVGLYILDILKKEKIFSDGNFGLYRDDGLAVVDILPGPDMERKVKQLRKVFKNIGLDVTIEANLFVTDFLDVTLDLQNESHKLYINQMRIRF